MRGTIRALPIRIEGLTHMDGKTYPITHTDAEWRQILTPEQYDVMRLHATEAPESCALLQEKRPGMFSCAACDQPLFESKRHHRLPVRSSRRQKPAQRAL